MREISIVIPVRAGGNPYIVLRSLKDETDLVAETIVSWDTESRGASWARNRGFEKARAQFLLFSDDDIEWCPGAIALLKEALVRDPDAAYSYGHYEMASVFQCNREFNGELLKRGSYISTMSLIRRDAFPGFDENLGRLQDWDLFLTMLRNGHRGRYCRRLIFRTQVRDGITLNGPVTWREAKDYISRKHGL